MTRADVAWIVVGALLGAVIGFGIARAVRRVMWEAPAACTCPDTRIFL